ncbi:MAG: glycosyltransferase family 2 protein [Candidatus Aenigmatarchaeota archaeon]
MSIALVPAYNEEKTIQEVIRRLKKVGLKAVVIDDCSKDRTFELAKRAGAIVLKHEKNKGKGEAIKTGINFLLKKYPSVENVIIVDADMQYLPDEAINFLKALKEEKTDFVMGKRDWSKVPLRHRLGNFIWRTSFNILFGQRMEDTNCGFVAFSRKAMEKIKNDIHGGYVLEDQMLISAVKNKFKIKQVPVSVNYKKRSGFLRGIRMVLGVLIFVIKEGIKYRLKID